MGVDRRCCSHQSISSKPLPSEHGHGSKAQQQIKKAFVHRKCLSYLEVVKSSRGSPIVIGCNEISSPRANHQESSVYILTVSSKYPPHAADAVASLSAALATALRVSLRTFAETGKGFSSLFQAATMAFSDSPSGQTTSPFKKSTK